MSWSLQEMIETKNIQNVLNVLEKEQLLYRYFLDNYCETLPVKCKSTLASNSTHEIM